MEIEFSSCELVLNACALAKTVTDFVAVVPHRVVEVSVELQRLLLDLLRLLHEDDLRRVHLNHVLLYGRQILEANRWLAVSASEDDFRVQLGDGTFLHFLFVLSDDLLQELHLVVAAARHLLPALFTRLTLLARLLFICRAVLAGLLRLVLRHWLLHNWFSFRFLLILLSIELKICVVPLALDRSQGALLLLHLGVSLWVLIQVEQLLFETTHSLAQLLVRQGKSSIVGLQIFDQSFLVVDLTFVHRLGQVDLLVCLAQLGLQRLDQFTLWVVLAQVTVAGARIDVAPTRGLIQSIRGPLR